MKNVIKLTSIAKSKGFAVAVKQGKFQLQTVEFAKNGIATVTANTGWITLEDAMKAVQ